VRCRCVVAGVCGGANSTRDCAGECFGSAVIDDCGVCAGGSTGKYIDGDKDCDGVCFGKDFSCVNGGAWRVVGCPSQHLRKECAPRVWQLGKGGGEGGPW
jgi:hypothetical protein